MTRTSPASAPISVVRMLTVVVLPAPLGPSSAKIVPSATVRSMPSSTTWPPKDLHSPVALIAGRDGMVVMLPRLVRVALLATTATRVRAASFGAVSRRFHRGGRLRVSPPRPRPAAAPGRRATPPPDLRAGPAVLDHPEEGALA